MKKISVSEQPWWFSIWHSPTHASRSLGALFVARFSRSLIFLPFDLAPPDTNDPDCRHFPRIAGPLAAVTTDQNLSRRAYVGETPRVRILELHRTLKLSIAVKYLLFAVPRNIPSVLKKRTRIQTARRLFTCIHPVCVMSHDVAPPSALSFTPALNAQCGSFISTLFRKRRAHSCRCRSRVNSESFVAKFCLRRICGIEEILP